MSDRSLASRSTGNAQFEVVPFKAALGAEIGGYNINDLDDAMFARIRKLWNEHILLAFRGQSVSAEDLVRLVKRFGTPVSSSNLHQRDLPERAAHQLYKLPAEVTVVSNVKEGDKSIGILGDGEIVWHSDFSFKEAPTAARMLVAREIPPDGGRTIFMNCYAAYEALSAEQKKRIKGLTIKQANIVDTAMKLRPGASLDDDIRPLWESKQADSIKKSVARGGKADTYQNYGAELATFSTIAMTTVGALAIIDLNLTMGALISKAHLEKVGLAKKD